MQNGPDVDVDILESGGKSVWASDIFGSDKSAVVWQYSVIVSHMDSPPARPPTKWHQCWKCRLSTLLGWQRPDLRGF